MVPMVHGTSSPVIVVAIFTARRKHSQCETSNFGFLAFKVFISSEGFKDRCTKYKSLLNSPIPDMPQDNYNEQVSQFSVSLFPVAFWFPIFPFPFYPAPFVIDV